MTGNGNHNNGGRWILPCPHCAWYIVVNNRGAHGRDPGAGVEAGLLMRSHVARAHAQATA